MDTNQMLYEALSRDLSGKDEDIVARYSRRIAVFSESPENLGIGEIRLKSLLWDFIDDAIDQGITTLYTGLSYGADSAAAELFAEKKRKNGDVRIVHTPAQCSGQRETDPALRGFEAGTFASSVDFTKSISGSSLMEAKRNRDRFIIDRCFHVVFVLDHSENNNDSYTWELLEYAAGSHRNAISHNIHIISCGSTQKEGACYGSPDSTVQDPLF